MTNWSIRTLAGVQLPYVWEVVDPQTIELLNKAYQDCLQTGKLAAIPSSVAKKPLQQVTNNSHKTKPTGGQQNGAKPDRKPKGGKIKDGKPNNIMPNGGNINDGKINDGRINDGKPNNDKVKDGKTMGDNPFGNKPSSDKPSLVANKNSRFSVNGSQKKRERKRKVAAEAAAALKAAATTQVTAAAIAPNDFKLTVSAATPTKTDTSNINSPKPEVLLVDTQLTGRKSGFKEQPLGSESPHVQVSVAQSLGSMSTVPPSPSLSPGLAKKTAHMPSMSPSNASSALSQNNSSASKPSVDDITIEHSGVTVGHDLEPSSPAASSITLESVDGSLVVDNVDDSFMISRDTNGNAIGGRITKEPQKKKYRDRRNQKSKKSKTALSTESGRDKRSEESLKIKFEDDEVEDDEVELIKREGEEPESQVVTESSSRGFDSYTYDELSRGAWHQLGETVLFTHPDTGIATLHHNTAKTDRYFRQQKRINATKERAEVDASRPPKIKSMKKARQVSLRRGHVAANSPLSLAMRPVRPRDAAKKQAELEAQSSSFEETQGDNLTGIGEIVIVNDTTDLRRLLLRMHQNTSNSTEEGMVAEKISRDAAVQLELDRDVGDRDFEDLGSDESDVSSQEHRVDEVLEDVENEESDQTHRVVVEEQDFVDIGREDSNQKRGAETHHFSFGLDDDSDGDSTAPNSGGTSGSPMYVFRSAGLRQDVGMCEETRSGAEIVSCVQQLQQVAPQEAEGEMSDENVTKSLSDNTPPPPWMHPEYGISQQTVQYDETRNESVENRVPVPLGLPSGDDSALCELHESAQQPKENGQQPHDDGQDPSDNSQRGHGGHHSRRGCGRGRGHGRGRGRGAPNDGGNYAFGHGGTSSGPGSDRGNHSSGQRNYRDSNVQVPTAVRRPEQIENKWATAVQDSDRAFYAQSMQRRVALEQDMEAKGTTYADYASTVEDSFIKRDEHGKTVVEEAEKIVYGPKSRLVVPSSSEL